MNRFDNGEPVMTTINDVNGTAPSTFSVEALMDDARNGLAMMGAAEAVIAEASLEIQECADRSRDVVRQQRHMRSRERREAIADRRAAAKAALAGSILNGVGTIAGSAAGQGNGGDAIKAAGELGKGLADFAGAMRTEDAAMHELVATEHQEVADDLRKDSDDADRTADKLLDGVAQISQAIQQARLRAAGG